MIRLLAIFVFIIIAISREPARIAFGSCNRFYQSHKMDIFQKIIKQKPSHMLFLGDFVYLDRPLYPTLPSRWYSEEDQSQILRKFNGVLNSPQFKAFAENNITVEIIWDDHDYNLNNGGTSNPMRFKMLEIFRSLFSSITIFQDSLHKLVKIDEKVTVLLLDVRSYKQSHSMFNEETWTWLKNVFRNTSSDELLLISSGIQVIYDDVIMKERWDLQSRLRLYKLLDKYKIHSLILSGDIHFGQIGEREGLNQITSSGLSFSVANHLYMAQEIVSNFVPTTYSKPSQRFVYRNFGLLQIHYHPNNTISHISAQIRDKQGSIAMQKTIPFHDTVLKQVNWDDLSVQHLQIFYQNMKSKFKQNPLRLLVYLPFFYPVVYMVLAVVELFHWKID